MNNGKHQHGWSVKPLGVAAVVTMGSSPPGESYNDEGKGVPLINGPVEFSEGDFGLTIRGKSTTEPTRMCRTGDLLLCVRGSTTGRTNIAGFEACIGRGVASIRAKDDQQFLNHFIRTQRQRLFDLGNGSTFPSITQEQLVSVQVPLPPLPEQRRIAAILDKADAMRRKREEGIRLTEELLRSTFLEMFGDPATNPKGLEVKPLSKVATVVMGSSPPSESYNGIGDGVPLINGPVEFSEGMLGFSVMTKYTTQPTQMCQTGDLLLCVRGSTTGRTNIAGFDACIGRGVAAIRASSCQDYLTYFITQRRQALYDSGKGSTFPSITQDQLRSLSVIWPPPQAQEHFAALFRKHQELVEGRKAAANEMENLFDSLVQRAFRGEL